jgi:hypothetical protein
MSILPIPPKVQSKLNRIEGLLSLELGEEEFWTLIFVTDGKTAVISPEKLGLSRADVVIALKRTIILLEGGEI